MRAAALALLGVLAAAAPAAACDAQARAVAKRGPGQATVPLIIGDSTMIIAVPALARLGLQADARGCRQFAQGVALLGRRARRLPTVVVLALGANGQVARSDVARARRILGRERFLVLVTPRNLGSSASALRAAARRHPDRVLLLDWAAHSAGREGWFGGDGLHPDHGGARIFARFVRRALRPFLDVPVRALDLPWRAGAAGALACGTVRAHGRRREVHVTRGADRITCRRARQLVRAPRMRPPAGWRYHHWAPSRRGPWSDVLSRSDRRVVVAAIPAR